MPVRLRIVEMLTQDTVGSQWFSFGKSQTMPPAEYEKVKTAADVLYERIVEEIDWNRVLIEASSRHFELMRTGAHPKASGKLLFEEVCPDCVREALLADETLPRLDPAPRVDTGQDWAAVIGHAQREYRRDG